MFIMQRASLNNATARARELRPTVIAGGNGGYIVSGSKGNDYVVTIRLVNDFHIVDCSCETRDSIACKHGVAAMALHTIISQVFVYQG